MARAVYEMALPIDAIRLGQRNTIAAQTFCS